MTQASNTTSSTAAERFRDRTITFANGAVGLNVDIPSASPLNYHQAISAPGEMPKLTVDGKLFLPPQSKRRTEGKLPLVIVAPGSLGVAPSHLAAAETVTNLGLAAFVLDSFGARNVTSTVANQTQFSFAASAYDVIAAWLVLAQHSDIDGNRIGAQGHSRGGTAVLTAATRRFADAVIGTGRGLVAVLAVYPWSGHQFQDARVGITEVRAIVGDADDWLSPTQVQGHIQAIRLTGANTSMRLVGGAHHSFDRGTAIVAVPDASVAPGAPTAYLADDGAFIHPLEATANPSLIDRDLILYGITAGFGRKGAKIGSRDGDAALFRNDMVTFWQRVLADQAQPDRRKT